MGSLISKKNSIFNFLFFLKDIAGQERFADMTHLFYKDAVGGLVVFDVSKPTTLTSGGVTWKEDFDRKLRFDDGSQVPCLLIGNKVNSSLGNKIKKKERSFFDIIV
jgi:GTPase SAR1 family protein